MLIETILLWLTTFLSSTSFRSSLSMLAPIFVYEQFLSSILDLFLGIGIVQNRTGRDWESLAWIQEIPWYLVESTSYWGEFGACFSDLSVRFSCLWIGALWQQNCGAHEGRDKEGERERAIGDRSIWQFVFPREASYWLRIDLYFEKGMHWLRDKYFSLRFSHFAALSRAIAQSVGRAAG